MRLYLDIRLNIEEKFVVFKLLTDSLCPNCSQAPLNSLLI